MSATARNLSPKRRKQFIAMWNARATREELMEEFSCGKSTVRDMAIELGLGPRSNPHHWKPEADAELTDLWNKGWTTSRIAKKMGKNKNQIIGRKNRLGLESRPSPIKRRDLPADASCHPSLVGDPATDKALPARPKRRQKPIPKRVRKCQWIEGEPTGIDELDFECTEKPLTGRPYCKHHTDLAYISRPSSSGALSEPSRGERKERFS